MRADIAEILRLAQEFQVRCARVVAAGRNSDGRQIIFTIRQRKAVTEGAVGTQFDLVPAKRDFRARLRRAVDDQFRVDVEPETFRLLTGTAERARRTGQTETRHAPRGRR